MTQFMTREELDQAIERLDVDLSKKGKEQLKNAFLKIIEEDQSPKEALNITPEIEETIYHSGHKFFRSGKYRPAMGCFNFLRNLDPLSYRYAFAVAACHHYMKDFEDASATYIISTHLNPTTPVPHFHLYDCFLKLNNQICALRAIETAVALADLDPRYASLKERAKMEADQLKKIIQERFQAEAKENKIDQQ